MVVILDTTLREGELHPGVYYTGEARKTVSRALAEVGTPRIEFPLVYPARGGNTNEVKEAVSELQQNYTKSMAVLHARAVREDVDLANSYDAKGCGIYMAATGIHRRGKFHGIGQQEVVDRFIDVLEFMKSCGFIYRRATIEDVSRFTVPEERSDEDTLDFLRNLLHAIQSAGATIIGIPDTSGILPQTHCKLFIQEISEMVAIPLACHFHNDYGNALGNALQAATVPSVEEINVSILGLGTRNGITDHYELVANLEDLHNTQTGERREKMRWLYDTFVNATGVPYPLTHPLSPCCFVEKAGTHQAQAVNNPRGYIPQKKIEYDSNHTILFEAGQLMSKQIVLKLLEEHTINRESVVAITNTIAARSAVRKRNVSPWEVQEIISAQSGIDIPIETIRSLIHDSDLAYILLTLTPQSPVSELINEVDNWKEVERADEVYGNVDVIIMTKMTDCEGNVVVDKIRNRFKNMIVKTVTLPVDKIPL
jgi:2-isopropylmalate synthase